jgi:hypothetical protein
MAQNDTASINEILQILYDGGRIDQFLNGNAFLSDRFGAPVSFNSEKFNLLLEEQLVQPVHLLVPSGSCYKISPFGLDRINQHRLENLFSGQENGCLG